MEKSATHLPPWLRFNRPRAADLSIVEWLKTLNSVVNIFTDEQVSNCLSNSVVVQSLALPMSWEINDRHWTGVPETEAPRNGGKLLLMMVNGTHLCCQFFMHRIRVGWVHTGQIML